MKKYLLVSIALLIFKGCSPSVTTIKEIDDHFLNDLGSENNRIAGDLSETIFEDNLDTLSYDFYIDYLNKNSTPSAKGLVDLIKSADENYFEATPDAFFIVLYYKCNGKIIGDYSETSLVDTVITITGKEDIPAFKNLLKKMGFK